MDSRPSDHSLPAIHVIHFSCEEWESLVILRLAETKKACTGQASRLPTEHEFLGVVTRTAVRD